MENKFNSKQILLNKTLENNFMKIRILVEKDISQFFITKDLFDLTPVNNKTATALYYNTLYYDIIY